MNPLLFPKSTWVNLETPRGKLLARFDAKRGILEIVERGEKFVFDLAQIVSEAQAPPMQPYPLPPLSTIQQI